MKEFPAHAASVNCYKFEFSRQYADPTPKRSSVTALGGMIFTTAAACKYVQIF